MLYSSAIPVHEPVDELSVPLLHFLHESDLEYLPQLQLGASFEVPEHLHDMEVAVTTSAVKGVTYEQSSSDNDHEKTSAEVSCYTIIELFHYILG